MEGTIEGTDLQIVASDDPHRGILLALITGDDTLHAGPFRSARDAEHWLGGFTACVQWAINEPAAFATSVGKSMFRKGTPATRAQICELISAAVDGLLQQLEERDG